MRHWAKLIPLCLLLSFATCPAAAFDFASYQPTDLDIVLQTPEPLQVDYLIHPIPERLRLRETLTRHAAPCDTVWLKRHLIAGGGENGKKFVENVAMTQCIEVTTRQGVKVTLFIQDVLTPYLQEEVPLGKTVELYAIYVYSHRGSPKILVNEFLSIPDK